MAAKEKQKSEKPKRRDRPEVENSKDVTRTVRLSETEDALVSKAAEIDRRPLASWMRDRLVLAAQRETEKTGKK